MSWFSKLTSRLKKTSETLTSSVTKIFTHKKIDAATLEDLEETLIQADLGVSVATKITTRLSKEKVEKETSVTEIQELMADEIAQILIPFEKKLPLLSSKKPFVILMAGVNGSGKTTTCAKLAYQLQTQGLSVAIAACDTFRAAAIEQLEVWGHRLSIPIIRRNLGADPSALAFDAYKEAEKKGYDVLLIDTAGRLHTNQTLMAELEKIQRVLKKIDAHLPHESFLVLDATIGQNAFIQIESFGKSVPLTGLVITKLDGTARGGVVVGITEKYHLPLYYVGVGESKDDLQPFHAVSFARAIVGLASSRHGAETV
ncbi:MAG: signal recognition particle-docking protein FtsY [Alphaproteobacteria bacterium RIFCSPHIGHO2_01_FULL_41_14]|nr:MAG: signal recognition particle-docking protein FtsY [Alphaproteobacteria bacterium GWA1_45_9]OFW90050.1 MAG: signal recognition particle-docking protein FtsY [Alphaproteobacteria bacterium RIFCSPHIGHO2_01_FULL_41_14]HCI48576.1 signal recognition particle-docking protein FtsY [Holosporales bacterium]